MTEDYSEYRLQVKQHIKSRYVLLDTEKGTAFAYQIQCAKCRKHVSVPHVGQPECNCYLRADLCPACFEVLMQIERERTASVERRLL